ncbi:TetR/AcrR family transcriptional regulator [Streptomyces sp. NPDC005474]|uniref:TetR/AcrR family transcriptional regulator n=1 Tax=Streptomyces sp. NPDC005474 TaxID=3154878 RepID=UPI00345302A2
MITESEAGPRERLLEAAATLSYAVGVNVGVEALCRAAGVSKRAMYQLFEGKDELIAARLEWRAVTSQGGLPSRDGDAASARERILRVFDEMAARSSSAGFWGCPYLAVQVELKDPEHPASRVARTVKQGLTDFFRAEAVRGHACNPGLLARQLTLLYDGASARAGIKADDLSNLITPTVVTLLNAAGLE